MLPPPGDVPNATLDSFVQFARPPPHIMATSQEIRDRGSTFIANIYQATTPEEAKSCMTYLKNVVHGSKPASHEIAAWRCMVMRYGKTGLAGPDDFELMSGCIDDGEEWAGSKVLKVMQSQAIIDAVVIVSRWFGGSLLGPARFTHIETCATEVCRDFKRTEEIRECVTTLSTLDDILAELRLELAKISIKEPEDTSSASSSTQSRDVGRVVKKPDYSSIDLPKARRLVLARENAIKNIKLLLRKHRNM